MADPAAAPFVRIVVLNWNAAWLTARCVRSLQATDYPTDRYEIVVVDNASIDGSLHRLRSDLSGVRFVVNPTNLGFAEGNNRALRDLDGCDHVALINNDAVVDPGWLRPLVDDLAAHPEAGAAAPKMLLESAFVTVPLTGPGTIAAVEVDGADVTRRCVWEHTVDRADPTVPLLVRRSVERNAAVAVPVGPRARRITVRWERHATAPTDVVVDVSPGTRRERRINSLGTALRPWTEGYERWFGERDRPRLGSHEVWGFSGGGVVLRADMLRQVGVFDPRWFAYYEDTDLAWRARRAGWTVRCVPASVVHHLHGGSAGPEAQGFFFLNYRNWLWTVLRNGSPRQLTTALRLAHHLAWGPFRHNVFGPVRRGRRPDLAITGSWARVAIGMAAGAPRVLATRARGRRDLDGSPIGAHPTEDVVSQWMPATPPRPPRPRVGGPLVVYVDVTETLRSGWRAGIQRVVCELVRHLPAADHDVELVPVTWSAVHGRFRRVDSDEYRRLLAPTGAQQPQRPAPSPGRARRVLAWVMHSGGLAPVVYRWRRWRELRAVPEHHRRLLLDRFEPGTTFLDVDATWNPTTRPRAELLPELRAGGVRTVMFVHDLLPQTHPEWFIPQLVDVSTAHLDAHLAAGSEFVCNSRHTAATLVDYASAHGVAVAEPTVAGLGATTVAADPAASPAAGADAPDQDVAEDATPPTFLVVGTVEPRKDHDTVLDAFEKVRAEHPDVRLVVVGRPGWNSAAVTARLEAAAGVDWRRDASDAELADLYRRARSVLVASVTEGYGLPVVEALGHGTPVISSNGGALPEAGGDLATYVDPGDVDALAAAMVAALDDEHHLAHRRAVATWRPPSWHDTALAVAARLSAP